MAYVKNPTKEQRKEWQIQQQQYEADMKAMIQDLTLSWQENPETIAEALNFGSKMYQYSVRNNMLIYSQNPNATYMQSFKAWKEMGASIRKGEKGCKVWVPVQATVLKVGNDLIPLEHATKEQKIQYHAGEIKSITETHFRIGTVFDISQTTYPKEQYPRLFSMGYESALHAAIVTGLIGYARDVLQCPVRVEDMSSVSLRGTYSPGTNTIKVNHLLEDTQRLSTLAHELGHAIQHQEQGTKSVAQIELEGDALGIMIESHFGIEPTDTRKRHLAENYRAYEKLYQKSEGLDNFGRILTNVFAAFKRELPSITEYVEKEMNTQHVQQRKQLQAAEMTQPERESIYDRIKTNVNILDYAAMHGYQLKRVGRYYTMQDHDSVRIDPDRNCFWRNSGVGITTTGSVIDFATAFVHGEDLHAALSELSSIVGGSGEYAAPVKRQERMKQISKKNLVEEMPERAKNMHRAYAYLTQTRYIDQDVVQDFVDSKMLYQDTKGNCVFVSYDEHKRPVFANFRGTLSDVKFLGDVPGSDYRRGFYIDNGADRLIVTESVIDAMSVMSILHAQGEDYKGYDYLALSGAAKQSAIHLHLAEKPKKEVLLALDHDLAGVKNMQSIRDRLLNDMSGLDMKEEQITYHVPSAKDWNADLAAKASRFQSLKELPFLEGSELPKIHYCAIQSTQHIEETGFRKRNGKDSYRLVEVKDGEIVPLDVKKNVIFRSPDELKELIPNMYEQIPYFELLQLQSTQKKQIEEQQAVSSAGQTTGVEEQEIKIKGYKVVDGCLMAIVLYKGEETEENVCMDQERYYVSTGYMQDHTYEEHDLSSMDQMELEEYIRENRLDLTELTGMLVLASVAGNVIDNQQKGADFLDELQKQQLDLQPAALEKETMLGIGG